jgi:hypothetical protein
VFYRYYDHQTKAEKRGFVARSSVCGRRRSGWPDCSKSKLQSLGDWQQCAFDDPLGLSASRLRACLCGRLLLQSPRCQPLRGCNCLAVSGSNQAYRAISTGQLNALLRLHLRPIDVVVFHGPQGRPCFEGGFPLRCLQRLSCPNIATQHYRWHDNWSTSGSFNPVLSY